MNERNIGNEKYKTSRILWFLYCFFLFLSLVIIIRIIHIQFFWEPSESTLEYFQPKKEKHEVQPERGAIMDCNGKLLAYSTPMYNINMDCTILKDEHEKDTKEGKTREQEWRKKAKLMADGIAEIMKEEGKDGDYYYNLIKANRDSQLKGRKNVPIAKGIDHSTLLKFQALPLFSEGRYKSGMIVRKVETRQYPYGELARRVIGDVKVDPENPDANRYVGIEGQYDHILRGTKGIEWMKRTDQGMIRNPDSTSVPVVHGQDIRTTIDIDIQDIADRALRRQIEDNPEVQGGCIVIMDVETGAIRAMVNLSRSAKNVLGEYFNSAIGRPAEPGSVFKSVSLLTLLEDNHIELETKIPTNHGRMREYPKMTPDEYITKYEYRNKTNQISIVEGFKISSNYVFRRLIKDYYGNQEKEFINRLYEYKLAPDAYTFDLTEKGATKPYIPDPNGAGWSGTDLVSTAIGYLVMQPPMNIAMFYNAIANNGKMMKPYLIESYESDGRIVNNRKPEILNGSICSKATADSMTRALKMVTLEGTATRLKNAKCEVAGKTGTARIVLDKNERTGSSDPYRSVDGKKKHQGTFVGFFPADDPKYTAIVTIWSGLTSQNFYGGTYPAIAFKEIVDAVWSLDEGWGEKLEQGGKIPAMNEKFIDSGKKGSPVPDLKGMGLKDAIYAIENNGYRCSYDGIGHVISQSPAAGTQYKQGQTIKIILK